MRPSATASTGLPSWLPDYALLYLRHVEEGVPIRQLAKAEGCHASTILRRVRRVESRRDDPLVDEALSTLGRLAAPAPRQTAPAVTSRKDMSMTAAIRNASLGPDDETIETEARRVLRRLAEPGAVLVVASEMDKAVVLRGTVRTAVLDRAVAQAFALKDWIQVTHTNRVTSYEIAPGGRAAVKRFLEEEARARGDYQPDDDAGPLHASQHRSWSRREVEEDGQRRRLRANLAESPLGVLARRRDKDGKPFLSAELVAAGERLREDFELAQMGPRVAQNWERFITGGARGQYNAQGALNGGSESARERVAAALRDLGPGLGDMVLRCCCFLEGLEAAEKRMGWSARSGKIVLRIALERLKRHYDEVYGGRAPLIG